ncbi:KH homology domain-containing protein 4-like [Haliotis rubra]|uniref:KH homology domain-containing protein 4-like n=1 Tax=Haliotis rubra TaxID=36100 RepID=UPI001EE54B71|nr:KH homology domain-containing protein 4-like [Haliotis rubra]
MYDENRSSLEAAAEAAAKVNAMLIAKGKLRPSQVNQNQSNRKSSSSNLVIAEVDINDVPIGCRNMLTRGSTQEEISKMSGSAVSTRGRYMTMDERVRNPGERALYLCVQGPNQEAVDLAVKRINEIIQNGMKQRGSRFSPAVRPPMNLPGPRQGVPMHQPPPLMSIGPQPPGPQVTVIQEKLYIGLEHAPPSFDVKNKILGVGGSFLQHIMNETGAKVTLRGKGSCFLDPAREREVFEPMHVHIQHTSMVGLQQAKQLAENLIQTVQQEYASFQQALAAMPTQVNPGTAALFAGIQQTSLPGNTLFTHQPGITTFSHLQQQPLAQVAAPGVQQIGHHPGMMAPHMIPVSTPTSVVMSGASLNSTLTNLTPSALITPAPGLTVSSGGPALVLPTSLAPVPVVTSMPVSATPIVAAGPPAPTTVSSQMEAAAAVVSAGLLPNTSLPPPMLQAQAVPTPSTYDVPITESQFLGAAAVNGGQPTHVILSQPPQPVTVQVAAPQLATPLGGPGQVATSLGGTALAPGAAPLGPAGGPLGPGVQLMTQTGLPPPGIPPPAGPPIGQPQPHQPFYTQYGPVSSGQPYCMVTSPMMCSSPAATYTVATSGYSYSVPLKEEPHKRRFTEEKQEEKIPENLLGYQHGPPHLTNLMTSGPPPPATMVSAALPIGQAFPPTSLSDDGRPYTSQANNGVVMAPPPTSVHDRPEADKHLMPPPGVKGVKRSHSGQGTPDTEKKSKTNLGYEEDGDENKRRGTQPPPPPPPDVEREHAELLEQEHREHLEREREQRDFYNPHFPGGKPQSFRSGSPQGPPRQSPPAPPPPHFEQINQQQISPFEQYTQNPQEQFGQAGQPPPPQFEQYPPPPQQFHHQQQIPTFSVSTSQSMPHFHQSPPSPQPPYSQAPNIRPPEAQMIISQHSQIQPPPPPSQQSQGLQPQFQSNQPFPPMPQNGYSQQFVSQQSQPPLPPPPPPPPQSQFPPPGMQYWV